ncbi:MAG: MATE family efflux transporter [Candidatus Merdivicinus sp.]
MVKDLTTGKPETVLWQFSLPMFGSVIFQQLYNIADSVIAGKFAGEDALAAVGASYPITMIFMAIAVGSNIGCSVVISQLFGGKRIAEMKTAINTALIAALGLSVLLTVGGLIGSPAMMRMIQTPDNIFSDADLYLRIYIGGFIFLFFYNISTSIFTALGDSKTPFYFLVGSSLGNIVLDWLFVAIFHWDVAGVAWATFLAQGVACILAMGSLLLRLKKMPADDSVQRFSGPMLIRIARISIPSILQQSFISIGNIFIQSLVNGFGSSVIAGYSAAIKLNTFTITSFTTLGNGLSSFTAQNIGAQKIDRVGKGFRAGMLMAFLVAIPFFLAYFFFGNAMISLFLEEKGGTALETGMAFLRIASPFYFVISVKLMADSVLRGAGDMRDFMVATFTDLILRVVLAYVFALALHLGTTGIWLSWPVGWSIASVMSFCYYRRGRWKTNL